MISLIKNSSYGGIIAILVASVLWGQQELRQHLPQHLDHWQLVL